MEQIWAERSEPMCLECAEDRTQLWECCPRAVVAQIIRTWSISTVVLTIAFHTELVTNLSNLVSANHLFCFTTIKVLVRCFCSTYKVFAFIICKDQFIQTIITLHEKCPPQLQHQLHIIKTGQALSPHSHCQWTNLTTQRTKWLTWQPLTNRAHSTKRSRQVGNYKLFRPSNISLVVD